MRKSRFTAAQIVAALHDGVARANVRSCVDGMGSQRRPTTAGRRGTAGARCRRRRG